MKATKKKKISKIKKKVIMKSYFMAHFKAIYKIHLKRDKNFNFKSQLQ